MAFTKEITRTPTAIGDMSVDLYSPDPTGTEAAGASFSVQVKMSDGSVVVRTGNLSPHLTTTQRNQLIAFMQTLRQQAIAEFMP